MKSLFFAGILLLATVSATYAQQSAVATATLNTQVVDEKRTFLSDINKLDAYTSRKVTAQADAAYNNLVATMRADMNSSKGKPELAEKQKLFMEIQALNTDREKNRADIKTKLEAYYELMP